MGWGNHHPYEKELKSSVDEEGKGGRDGLMSQVIPKEKKKKR